MNDFAVELSFLESTIEASAHHTSAREEGTRCIQTSLNTARLDFTATLTRCTTGILCLTTPSIPTWATPRERYEAVARSLRDVLALRWQRTKKTHYEANPKRVYYLSMEFLIGRSLASNVSNLMLDSMLDACREKNVDWYELLDQEPNAGLGNGG